MDVFLDSTAAPDCRTGQNKGRHREKELSFLLVLLEKVMDNYFIHFFEDGTKMKISSEL